MGRTLLKIIVAVALVICAVLVYGVSNGWTTTQQFGQGLFQSGVVVVGFGLLALLANSRGATDPDYIHMQGLMRHDVIGEARRSRLEFASRLSLPTYALLIGAILLLAGYIVRNFG